MGKKKNDSIRISFVDSMSAQDVTGSCTYVETPNHKILVDCGLYQSDNLIYDFKLNKRHFKELKLCSSTKDNKNKIKILSKIGNNKIGILNNIPLFKIKEIIEET